MWQKLIVNSLYHAIGNTETFNKVSILQLANHLQPIV